MKSYLRQRKRSRFVLAESRKYDQFSRSPDIHNIVSGHVETVVCLGKNFSKPKDYIQIGIDAEDYYRIKESEKKSE